MVNTSWISKPQKLKRMKFSPNTSSHNQKKKKNSSTQQKIHLHMCSLQTLHHAFKQKEKKILSQPWLKLYGSQNLKSWREWNALQTLAHTIKQKFKKKKIISPTKNSPAHVLFPNTTSHIQIKIKRHYPSHGNIPWILKHELKRMKSSLNIGSHNQTKTKKTHQSDKKFTCTCFSPNTAAHIQTKIKKKKNIVPSMVKTLWASIPKELERMISI